VSPRPALRRALVHLALVHLAFLFLSYWLPPNHAGEGGIRGNSFISGGFLPTKMRGVVYDGLVTVWDHYATFCHLAGVDPTDHRAAKAGLPPIDGVSHALMILGTNLTSPRTELPIGTEPRTSNLSTAPLCASSCSLFVALLCVATLVSVLLAAPGQEPWPWVACG
jgi:hypothetical protein